jgi:hypothetical protein
MKLVRMQLLLLTAIIAVAALLPSTAAAVKTTKVYSVQSNGFLETEASSKQTFKLGAAEAECTGFAVKSPKEYTIGTYTKISLHPEYTKCTARIEGFGEGPAKVSATGCAYEFSSPVGEFNSWTANVSIVSFEKTACSFVIKSVCEVKIPVEGNKILQAVNINNINEIQSETPPTKSDVGGVSAEVRELHSATTCGEITEKNSAGTYVGQVEVKRVVVRTK